MKLLNILAALSLVMFIGCGGGSNEQQADSSAQTAEKESTQSETSSNDVRTIEVIGIDKMKFVVKSNADGISVGEELSDDGMLLLKGITAKPGEKIRVKLTTKSKLPAMAMSHNFILLKRDADPEAFDKAASKAKDNDYIPSGMTDKIIAHSGLAAGGETVEVTFTAPEKTGENTFLCSFPGHFASGMKGTLTVEK